MRNLLLLLFACFGTVSINAQLVINGGTLTLGDNAVITVQGDLTSSGDILGTGKVVMNGTAPQQLNTNGFTIPNLEINSTGGVTLAGNVRIGNTLNFIAGTLSTNPATANELIAPLSATFSFAAGTEIIGKVRRNDWVNGSAVIFNNTNMKITTAGGTAPTSMLVNMIPNGNPSQTEREVKRSFAFTPTGGSGYTADVTFPYLASELVANNNTEANLVPWYLVSSEWNAKLTGNTINTGSDFVATTGIASTTFATSEWKLADPLYTFNVNAALRGIWNGSTMGTSLNSAGLIPLSQPYNTTPFSYTGTESVASIPNANIVDWVLLELRKPTSALPEDATSSTIIGRKAAFILSNGTIVDLDGVTPASFNISKQGSAFVVVRHRNHLGVMSTIKPSNETGSFANDFTILANSYKQPAAPSDPVVLLSGGTKYGLWAGDANKDQTVNAVDVSAVKLGIANSATGYLFTDCNLDGNINAIDVSLVKVTTAGSGSGSVSRMGNVKIKSSLPE